MPRLPTIRVIGSQDISLTMIFCCEGVSIAISCSPHSASAAHEIKVTATLFPLPSPPLRVAAGQGPAPAPPFGLDVVLGLDVALAEIAHHRPVGVFRDPGRPPAPLVLVHERHELVREAGHRAGHADTADVRAAADAVDPAAIRHVALDHGSLAAELDQAAVIVSVLGRVLALLGEPGPVAALTDGAPEQPLGPQRLVELRRRSQAGEVQGEVEEHLGHVVGLRRAAWDAHDRQAGLGLPAPAQVVGQAHGAGGIVLHRRDAAIGGAGADRDDCGGLRREPVHPLVHRDRLPVLRIHGEAGPVALTVYLLVAERALDHQHERIQLALLGVEPRLRVLVAHRVVDHLVVDDHLGHARDGLQDDVLEALVRRRGHRHRVPLAAEARGHPQDVSGDRLCLLVVCKRSCHPVSSRSQQIRGSGSPTSWSMTRRPPKLVCINTMPGGSVRTSPISAACSQPGTALSARSASSAASGATNTSILPSLATYIGSIPRISAAPATAGCTGTSRSRTTIATADERAISFRTDATPPRVASRMQRRCDPADSSNASTAGHSERVSDSISASSSNSPRASMIAVPCSPMLPESRIRSPGRTAEGDSSARGSRRPSPVVQTYIPSACPRSTTLVSPATISMPASCAAAAIASTSRRRSSAGSPSSSTSDSVSATGRAPETARSLTVPLTASSPIDPPGNRSGLTT